MSAPANGPSSHSLSVIATPTDGQGVCRVLLSGHFTFAAHEQFSEVLTLLAECGAKRFVMDLSGLAFLDSAGLWMVLVARSEAARDGIAFELRGAEALTPLLSPTALGALEEVVPAASEGPLVLALQGPPPSWLPAKAGGLGLPVVRASAVPVGSRPLLLATATEDNIRRGLAAPHAGFVELAGDGLAGLGRRCLDTARRGGLVLSVSTATAHALDLAQLFAEAVCARLPVGSGAALEVALCLSEAVGNSVIHGNLGIDSKMRATREGFNLFRRLVAERLADPLCAGRRVEVEFLPLDGSSFQLAVSDRGQGFDVERHLAHMPAADAKYGRGIALIRKIARAVNAENGGRTLVMTF